MKRTWHQSVRAGVKNRIKSKLLITITNSYVELGRTLIYKNKTVISVKFKDSRDIYSIKAKRNSSYYVGNHYKN